MKDEHDDKDHGSREIIILKFIVNGTPTEVKVNIHPPLKVAVEKALKQTGNTGRPLEDWELKWLDKVLDISKSAKDYKIPNGTELFLSLRAGQGGAVWLK